MKLTFIEWIMNYFGFEYVVNMNPKSKEIHRIERKHVNCHIDKMKRKKYVTEKKALKLIKEKGFNGCMFCWRVADKG